MAAFAPITVKEALVGGTGFPKITENTLVCIVARVTRIANFKYKIVFELRDLTGTINAVFWLDENVPELIITNNVYVQVFGTLQVKDEEGSQKKELLVFKISAITEIDAITCHYLQCFHKKHMDPLYYEKVLFNYFKKAEIKSDLEKGIPSEILFEDLELQKIMSNSDIRNALNALWNRGYIYSTKDERHFKITMAFDEVYYTAKV